MTEALKNRDTEVLRVLRFSKASLAAAEKEQGTYLSDADFVKIIGKKIKQSQDSISQFKKGSRTDLVAAEEQEIAILSRYMPQPLVEAELSKKGFDPVLGARPLRRLIQDTLEANLSRLILENKLVKGQPFKADLVLLR